MDDLKNQPQSPAAKRLSGKYPALTQNHLFLKVYGKGRSFASGGLVLYVLRNYDRKTTLTGFTVSKSRGKAVTRNKIRRRMKEAYRSLYPLVKKGFLIVIVARQSCEKYSSTQLRGQLYGLLKKAELFGIEN